MEVDRLPGLGPLVIRPDSGGSVGAGHAMRCLALAERWKALGQEVHFLLGEHRPALAERIRAEGVNVVRAGIGDWSVGDAEETASLAASVGARWVVVDSYRAAPEYQIALSERAASWILLIDDTGCLKGHLAEAVLDATPGANRCVYSADSGGRAPELMLGEGFALIRSEFERARAVRRPPEGPVESVLLTLGGVDPDGMTAALIGPLVEALPGRRLTAVVGAENVQVDGIRAAAAAVGEAVQVEVIVGACDMGSLLAEADLVVAAASTTALEAACAALPSVLVVLADNQAALAGAFASRGAASVLDGSAGPLAIARAAAEIAEDSGLRSALSAAAARLVDGRGAFRAARHLARGPLHLRAAGRDDAMLLLDWANGDDVRESAFGRHEIGWAEHCEWLDRRLGDTGTMIWIAEDSRGVPVGQVRFEMCDGPRATADVIVDPGCRGEGLASRIISAGVSVLCARGVPAVEACVRLGNDESLAAFRASGFTEESRDARAVTMTLDIGRG